MSPVKLTDMRGGGEGAKKDDGEKALSSINHSRLSEVHRSKSFAANISENETIVN